MFLATIFCIFYNIVSENDGKHPKSSNMDMQGSPSNLGYAATTIASKNINQPATPPTPTMDKSNQTFNVIGDFCQSRNQILLNLPVELKFDPWWCLRSARQPF